MTTTRTTVRFPPKMYADGRCSESDGSHTSCGTAVSQPIVSHHHHSHRSTKGASKQRRDHINNEIGRLRDLLPLSEAARDRLFQLQVMSLACVYIRKHRYVPHVVGDWCGPPPPPDLHFQPHGALKFEPANRGALWHMTKELAQPALDGFLIMVTRQGKLLYVSDNIADYIGHSVEEVMSQGDNLADVLDPKDVPKMRAELASGPPGVQTGAFPQEKRLVLRLNCSRTSKRQLQYQKLLLIRGRYLHPSEYYRALASLAGGPTTTATGANGALNHPALISPVFAGRCALLLNPDNVDALAATAGSTDLFRTVHAVDMRLVYIDDVGTSYLGWSNDDIDLDDEDDNNKSLSWYNLLHPADLHQAAAKHRQVSVEREPAAMLLARLQTKTGGWLWTHCILALKTPACIAAPNGVHSTQLPPAPVPNEPLYILATHQVLSDDEAATLADQHGWLYAGRHQALAGATGRPAATVANTGGTNTDTVSSDGTASTGTADSLSDRGATAHWHNPGAAGAVLVNVSHEPLQHRPLQQPAPVHAVVVDNVLPRTVLPVAHSHHLASVPLSLPEIEPSVLEEFFDRCK